MQLVFFRTEFSPMPGHKSRAFIASSTEGLHFATAVKTNLHPRVECALWTEEFKLSHSTLQNVLDAVERYDFGIFVISPDDKIEIRGDQHHIARDNVIFELGAFFGKMGQQRAFIFCPMRRPDLRLPSDLLGITYAGFDADRIDGDWAAALAPACAQVRQRIEGLGPRENTSSEFTSTAIPNYVAAICLRRVAANYEVLLVRTTQGRRMFPKGKVKKGECPRTAAIRYAYKEGGVFGKAAIDEDIAFKYFKEGDDGEHKVVGVLIDETDSVIPREEFRDPQWYSLLEAERILCDRRDLFYAEELRQVVRWADSQARVSAMPREQVAALPFKVIGGVIRVLLVTSKTRHRWILPKGGVRSGLTARAAATEEALEEAGVQGYVSEAPIGKYGYLRLGARHDVIVYSMEVTREYKEWPEKVYRQRKWMKLEQAAEVVDDKELQHILRGFRSSIGEANYGRIWNIPGNSRQSVDPHNV
jgi:8-oxo-dGTP pyrophosphatase MutT (NUDIX family)